MPEHERARAQPKESSKAPKPPQLPEIKRRVHLTLAQRIGIPIMVSIPLLAMLGILDASRAASTQASGALELRVAYPTRFDYTMLDFISVAVRNRSSERIDTVTVAFDTAYVSRFSEVSFHPSVSRAYQVELTDVEPNESRLVRVDLQGERYGRHEGTVTAVADGDTASVPIHTVILP